jgi:hypothetical protein
VEEQRLLGPTRNWLKVKPAVMTAGGRQRTGAEHRALLARTGLRLTRIIPCTGMVSLVEAVPDSPS